MPMASGMNSTSERIAQVAGTPGLVAFWDFVRQRAGQWIAYHDPALHDCDYPLWLRRIGDPRRYRLADWPYADEDSRWDGHGAGPFGGVLRCNLGHVFAEVAREDFAHTPLDISGYRSFTLLAWARFIGRRHFVAGIWDEGGWDRYQGRRQYALFAGLFGAQGAVAHLSATGAASWPQSNLPGAQYARVKAIDGGAFADGQWVCLGMTYAADQRSFAAWQDGICTPHRLADPVKQDVFSLIGDEPINPAPFPLPIFGPRRFVMKFNGYALATNGVAEHRLLLDLVGGEARYQRLPAVPTGDPHRVTVTLDRAGLMHVMAQEVVVGPDQALPLSATAVHEGDVVVATLERQHAGSWIMVGAPVRRTIAPGAPFTFGRALGLGSEDQSHGSQVLIGGVAVFNRVLDAGELRHLAGAS